MFTGLIEDVGRVRILSGSELTVVSGIASEIGEGDSVSVDGSCLTATGSRDGEMSFHFTGETASRSIVSFYSPGTLVNLERPLLMSQRLHGHMVTGHVDMVSRVLRVERRGGDMTAWISYTSRFSRLLVEKGSVAVNGISLTVASLSPDRFSVAMIPETLERTTADSWKPGTRVNLEFDIIGKYVLRQMNAVHESGKLRKYIETE